MTIPVTASIQLVSIEPKHAQPIFELAASDRGHLRQWLSWVDNMHTVSFIENFIRGSQQRNLAGTEEAFVILENGNVVGRIGIYKIDTYNRIGELGYWVTSTAQGRGIISQCCQVLINHCFYTLQLNRVEIKCAVDNHKSQAVPERLGFGKEGIMRQGEWLNGRFVDLVLYAVVKGEWR